MAKLALLGELSHIGRPTHQLLLPFPPPNSSVKMQKQRKKGSICPRWLVLGFKAYLEDFRFTFLPSPTPPIEQKDRKIDTKNGSRCPKWAIFAALSHIWRPPDSLYRRFPSPPSLQQKSCEVKFGQFGASSLMWRTADQLSLPLPPFPPYKSRK